eukprot:723911-Pyramimonas_sp.AAC.1
MRNQNGACSHRASRICHAVSVTNNFLQLIVQRLWGAFIATSRSLAPLPLAAMLVEVGDGDARQGQA